jgi:SAM-dependent methyltransferase
MFLHTKNILENEIENNKLHQLGLKYNTDKAYFHKFTLLYDIYLKKHVLEYTNILELGIFNTASIKMWNDYFINATIYGFDIDKHSVDKIKSLNNDKLKAYEINCGNRGDLEIFLNNINFNFDFIIDDASHYMEHQQISFAVLFKHLKKNGIYIIEDLQTSYLPEIELSGGATIENNTFDLLKNFQNSGKIKSVYLTDEENEYLENNILEIILLGRTNDYPKHYGEGTLGNSFSSIIIKK